MTISKEHTHADKHTHSFDHKDSFNIPSMRPNICESVSKHFKVQMTAKRGLFINVIGGKWQLCVYLLHLCLNMSIYELSVSTFNKQSLCVNTCGKTKTGCVCTL